MRNIRCRRKLPRPRYILDGYTGQKPASGRFLLSEIAHEQDIQPTDGSIQSLVIYFHGVELADNAARLRINLRKQLRTDHAYFVYDQPTPLEHTLCDVALIRCICSLDTCQTDATRTVQSAVTACKAAIRYSRLICQPHTPNNSRNNDMPFDFPVPGVP